MTVNEGWSQAAAQVLFELMNEADASDTHTASKNVLAGISPNVTYEVTVRRLPPEPDQRPEWLRAVTSSLDSLLPQATESPAWLGLPGGTGMTRHCGWAGCRYYQIMMGQLGMTPSDTQHLCERDGTIWAVTWPA